MKAWLIALVSLAMGALAGAGWAWSSLAGDAPAFHIPGQNLPAASAGPAQGNPQVEVVNGAEHDFGRMEVGATKAHTFVFRNVGVAPLRLSKGETTCKCTIGELTKGQLLPGETTEVRLEWTPKAYAPEFRQTAHIRTNDPYRDVVELTIVGEVTNTIHATPESVNFGRVSANEEGKAAVHIFDSEREDLEITSYELLNDETAKYYSISYGPLAPEEVKKQQALSGIELTVKSKRGMPLGPMRQQLALTFNNQSGRNMKLPFIGEIVSDISLVGSPKHFNPTYNLIFFGPVKQSQGKQTQLIVLIKGPHREEVDITVAKVIPADVLQVSLGERETAGGGKLVKKTLKVRIPPGARLVSYMGRANEEDDKRAMGKIVLHTTHPDVKEVPIDVRFAVVK